jgi:phosphomannomutase
MVNEAIFKAYDVRGVYPAEIDEEAVYKITQAYAKLLDAKTVVLGRDVRLSGPSLFEAAVRGLTDHGVNVIDIGVVTTDTMYFASAHLPCDGGITISASHNPKEYNGLKMVRHGAVPISGDTGIEDIKRMVRDGYIYKAETAGVLRREDVTGPYLQKCLSFIDKNSLRRMKVVANGMFGPAVQNVIKANLPIDLIAVNEVPDGNFPKGQPDPMQARNREETIALIQKEKSDLGAAWDADADRFFLFDENGRFIPGYYLTAFLGEYFAKREKTARIIHDPRLTWAIEDKVMAAGGIPLAHKCGHSFIKERMRKEDAAFAGESSGHFYFRDFYYADNGFIPFLVMLQIISDFKGKTSELFDELFQKYPISGEINVKLDGSRSAKEILAHVEAQYPDAKKNTIDGLSIEYPEWRASIRGSNTEPLVRLNVEARNSDVLEIRTSELQALIAGA